MLRRWMPDLVDVLPAALAVLALVLLSDHEAGQEATAWYPAALFLLLALAVAVIAGRNGAPTLSRLNWCAIGLLAAFTAWCFVSILWADVAATAWEGADRMLLYLVVFALFSLCRWRPATAAGALGLYALLLAVVGALTLLRLTNADDPAQSFVDGRLVAPAGYANAAAALFLGGLWPALALAARRETPWPLRGLLLAAAGLFVQLALMTQSRGATIILPLVLLLLVALGPARLRLLAVIALVAAASVLTAPAVLDVYDVVRSGTDPAAAIDDATRSIALACLGLAVVGSALALLDNRRRLAPRVREATSRAVLVIAVVAALGAGAAAVVAVGNPVSWTQDRWDDFKGGYDDNFEASRFTGDIGSNRYDFWRVGLGTSFAEAPLVGQGADNFATDYLRERQSAEEPEYPHSLEVSVLAGTGLVGALLFLGFAGTAVVAAARGLRRQGSGLGRAAAGAAIAAFTYWGLHASGDWLAAFTAVTAPAFAWLALAGTMPAPATELETAPQRSTGAGARRALLAAFVVVAAVAAVSLVPPWFAAKDSSRAVDLSAADPAAAYELLDRAASSNPLSAEPAVLAGSIAAREGDLERATEQFGEAIDRDPDNWYALLMLATVRAETSAQGSGAGSAALLARALAANPHEVLLQRASRRAEAGHSLGLAEIERELVGRVCDRVGPAAGGPCSNAPQS
jgi:O-antigen ligase